MNLCYIISSLILTVGQFIFSCEGSPSKCYECSNICCEADHGKAKDFCAHFNDSCKTNCLQFPFHTNDKSSITASLCSVPDEKCFTADGLMKYKVIIDNSIFTMRYVQRGCIQTCPVNVCDFSKLKECQFSPEVTHYLEGKINKEKGALIKRIHETFGGQDNIVDLGMGGELRCCKGEGCNNTNETEVAHTYIKDEL